MSTQLSLFADISSVTEKPHPGRPADGVKRISDEPLPVAVLNVLQQCRAEGSRIYLPDVQLDRQLYVQVDEVFKRLLGEWKGGRTRAHIFPYDVEAILAALVASGNMPVKNPSAYFPTPEPVIDCMLAWGGVNGYSSYKCILEPSAGQGAIARRLADMFPDSQLDVCELLDVNRAALQAKGFNIVSHDFLKFQPERPYELIIMNPPFTVDGDSQAYITHIMHAWQMLAPKGKLVSIAPMGWTFGSSKVQADFRQWVFDFGEYDVLDDGAFKESGTGVKSVVVWADKPNDEKSWRRRPHQGFNSHHSWELLLLLENNTRWCEEYHEIMVGLADGTYQVDLSGTPVGEARKALVSLFNQVQDESNRDLGRIFLLPEDIEFLLRGTVLDAVDSYGG